MKYLLSTIVFTSAAMLAACQPATQSIDKVTEQIVEQAVKQPALEVFLVRHAEKTKDADDPALTEAGEQRAELLADLLIDANITHIHSSDYKRTRDTAQPLAARLGLPVALYDPRDLPAMAAKLKAEGGKHLVVGHSNTTPPLTELLGGQGGTPIVEATEYNRLYFVTIGTNGQVSTTLLRFGD